MSQKKARAMGFNGNERFSIPRILMSRPYYFRTLQSVNTQVAPGALRRWPVIMVIHTAWLIAMDKD